MKKRLLSSLLFLCMVLSLLPTHALASLELPLMEQPTADNDHTFGVACDGEGDIQHQWYRELATTAALPHIHAMSVGCETDSGEQLTFEKALTGDDNGKLCVDGVALSCRSSNNSKEYTLPGGNYYLPDDVTLDNAYIKIEDEEPVNLCLNGHTLDLGAERIYVVRSSGGALNLCDCGDGGTVTGAFSGTDDYAATLEACGGEFSLYGGTVANTAPASDNSNYHHYAVSVSSGSTANRYHLYGGNLVSANDGGLSIDVSRGTGGLDLSGDVSIRGGDGRADIYLYYFTSDYSQKNSPFTLTGPLTKPQNPWKVAVRTARLTRLLSGWSQYMDDANFADYFTCVTPGLFVNQKEDGDLELAFCAITQHPTADNDYTVAANGAPASVPSYQWYPATVGPVTTENAQAYTVADDNVSSYDDGKWTAAISEGHKGNYFTISLKAGEILAVTLPTDATSPLGALWFGGQAYFFGSNPGAAVITPEVGVSASVDGANTVITYTVPRDGEYDLQALALNYTNFFPAISAKVTRFTQGDPLTGQTTPTLTTAPTAGYYHCKVTWPNGTALNSDAIFYEPPPHAHSWATDWSSDGTGHWYQCTAQDCDITDYATCGEAGAAYAPHSAGDWQKDEANHWKICPDCGYELSKAAHDYDGDWQKDETNHWKICSDCGYELSKAAHDYDGEQDTTCDTCGYTRTVTPVTPVTPTRPVTVRPTQPETPETPAWPFVDVAEEDWFYTGVKYVYGETLMEGFSDNTFSPDGDISRAMVATILWQLAGGPETGAAPSYPDCDADSWYAAAVAWGSEQGVMQGCDNGTFRPDAPITREQLVVMLYRYAGSPATDGTLEGFVDADKIETWAIDALRWAVEQGILIGKGSGVLDPAGIATRGEAATILVRYLDR